MALFEKNKEKYVINMRFLDNTNDLYAIRDITSKINRNFTVYDVSELFSLEINSVESQMKKLISQL